MYYCYSFVIITPVKKQMFGEENVTACLGLENQTRDFVPGVRFDLK